MVRKKPYIRGSFQRSLNRENVQAYLNGIPVVLLCSVHFTVLSIFPHYIVPDDSMPTGEDMAGSGRGLPTFSAGTENLNHIGRVSAQVQIKHLPNTSL
jgi:hypothetical protein